MGAAKLALPLGEATVLETTLAQVARAGLPALVVLGAHAGRLRPLLKDVPAVEAADHHRGLAHSLKAGLQAAPADWQGVLVVLGDMPFVRPETYARLTRRLAAGAEAVRPAFGGVPGNPVGLARSLFPRLMALEGDRGAAALLPGLAVEEVAVDDPGVLRDIDTPADLAAAAAMPAPAR